jgi:S-DNA-T family DNA segregation ATPase FtsK/SpoIIIE
MKKNKKRNTKKKAIKKKKKNFEAKGILIFSFSFLLLLSLLSFNSNSVKANYLGYLGYYISYIITFLFGLSSYLFVIYLGFLALHLIKKEKSVNFVFRSINFIFLLISTSFLLTIYAESFPSIANIFSNKIIAQDVYLYEPTTQIVTRNNLGGVPFYYIYKDLSFFNLNKILSSIGCTLIFSTIALISFLLFSNLSVITKLNKIKQSLNKKKKKNLKKLKINKTPTKKLRHKFFEALDTFIKHLKTKNEKQVKPHITRVNIKQNILKKDLPPTLIQKKEKINEIINEKFDEKLLKQKENDLKITTSKTSLEPKKEPTFLEKLKSPYKLPSVNLLTNPKQVDHPTITKELTRQAAVLEETLKNFGIDAKVGEINCGPTITSFEVHPSIGVKVQKIKALENDIALNLEAKSIRIIAPIPGKAAVGVEIPSLYPQEVSLKEMLLYYQNTKKMKVPLLLGKSVTGEYITADLTKTPHLLIAGATGSGKSVCINALVMSIIMNASPDEIKLLMVDPKKVELTGYSNLPHMLSPVITEAHGAYAALQWLVREMHLRYDILKHLRLRNIAAFNSRKINKEREAEFYKEIPEKMPLIVAIFDEFADLMMVSSADLETPIARIAQMARAIGIHLILATQRPSREVITGIIKANFPSRIAFKVSSRINSQIILDEVGAESLLGNGDLLFLPPGSSTLIRAQGAFIRDEDINKVIEMICDKYPPNYLISSFDAMAKLEEKKSTDAKDKFYDQALEIVLATRNASTTFLQRKLKIGYARAASLMDELEENGIIGPQEGSKPRKILTLE